MGLVASRIDAVRRLVRRGSSSGSTQSAPAPSPAPAPAPAKPDRPAFGFDQRSWKERGHLDVVVMGAVATGEVALGLSTPSLSAAIAHELMLGRRKTAIPYATDHPRQLLDITWPEPEPTGETGASWRGAGAGVSSLPDSPRGERGRCYSSCVFVHGGAWCWGERFHYASAARTLADALRCPVLVPSYRSYPHGDASMMARDVAQALRCAADRFGPGTLLVGHSAGAAISLCALAALAGAPTPAAVPQTSPSGAQPGRTGDAPAGSVSPGPGECLALLRSVAHVVALSGVSDVAAHFAFEAARRADVPVLGRLSGVERLSPMCPATGGARRWHAASPAAMLPAVPPRNRALLPPLTLVHGSIDATVPLSSSLQLRRVAAACGMRTRLVLLQGCDHSDTVLPLMAPVFSRPVPSRGGRKLRDLLIDAMRRQEHCRPSRL